MSDKIVKTSIEPMTLEQARRMLQKQISVGAACSTQPFRYDAFRQLPCAIMGVETGNALFIMEYDGHNYLIDQRYYTKDNKIIFKMNLECDAREVKISLFRALIAKMVKREREEREGTPLGKLKKGLKEYDKNKEEIEKDHKSGTVADVVNDAKEKEDKKNGK